MASTASLQSDCFDGTLLGTILSDLVPIICRYHQARGREIHTLKTGPLELTRTFGKEVMSYPFGLAMDRAGNFYVVDQTQDQVLIFQNDGTLLSKLGKPWGPEAVQPQSLSPADGEFNQPSTLTFDLEDNLVVLDTGNNCVQLFQQDTEGTWKFKAKWGSPGTGDGQLRSPSGICVDRDGRTIIADTENNRIQIFTSSGTWIKTIPGFNDPVGITTDISGNIYVTENEPSQVRVLSPEGETIRTLARTGVDDGELMYPWSVTVDKTGHVLTSDSRIQLFSPTGEFIRQVNVHGDALSNPKTCVIDREGNLILIDVSNKRLVVYE